MSLSSIIALLAAGLMTLTSAPSAATASESRLASAGTAALGVSNSTRIDRDMRRSSGDGAGRHLTPCDRVIARLCREGGADVCASIQKHALKRSFTERDQKECGEMLANPTKFAEVLRTLQRASRP